MPIFRSPFLCAVPVAVLCSGTVWAEEASIGSREDDFLIGASVVSGTSHVGTAQSASTDLKPLWAFQLGPLRVSRSRASALMSVGREALETGLSTEFKATEDISLSASLRLDNGRSFADDPLLRGLPGLGHWGAVMGAGLATAVGISRVVVEAHSPSEVALAWLLGCAVAASVLLALGAARPRHPALIVAPLLLLGSFHTPAATYLPSHSWEVRVALWLSGQPQPFTRADLHGVGPLSPARP